MGKRSSFRRVARDFYPTPFKAVPPLIPYLRGVRTFAEPCAGGGALVRHLEGAGLRCAYAGDIATGRDALARHSYGAADAIITNPPYTRELMHRLIEHFQRIAPTWLLIDYDWAATKQAAPFLPHCSDIVILPRLKWIEGSKDTGKDNHAWYRFDAHHSSGPVFHARGAVPMGSHVSLCAQCGKPYRPQRSDSRFCSDRCRQRAHRRRQSRDKP
jgi:predicted nucleic acid-binding Zn ribbon protein